MQVEQKEVVIVGAGPGDVELITLKGRKLLDEADCIVYAGSLVNKELLRGCSAEIHDSAGMNLEETTEVIYKCWKEGGKAVRLHTGLPGKRRD